MTLDDLLQSQTDKSCGHGSYGYGRDPVNQIAEKIHQRVPQFHTEFSGFQLTLQISYK
jgi:hypothetical protein